MNYKRLLIGLSVGIFIIVSLVSVSKPKETRDTGTPTYELTYKEKKTDNTIKCYYTDEKDHMVSPCNLSYTYILKTIENDNVVLEAYYDDSDKLVNLWGDYSMISRTYNEAHECTSYSYLDTSKHKVNHLYAYYATVKREFNDKHQCILESFYDSSNHQVCNSNGVYAQRYTYNDNNLIDTITYLSKDKEVMTGNNGITSVKRKYNDKYQVIQESYYDQKGNCIKNTSGYYGIKYGYDKEGRQYKVTYLNKSFKPMILESVGYATVVRSYYKNNSIKKEMYYDTEGSPVHLSRGHSGILYTTGQTQYLNSKGHVMFLPDIFLRSNPYVAITIAIVIVSLSLLLSKKYNKFLLFAYMLFIIYMTLLNRSSVGASLQLTPFATYSTFFNNYSNRLFIIENIWLFIPFIVILYKLYPNVKTLVIVLIVSIIIEVLQYYLKAGVSDIDDIISNLAGGITGYLFINEFSKDKMKHMP